MPTTTPDPTPGSVDLDKLRYDEAYFLVQLFRGTYQVYAAELDRRSAVLLRAHGLKASELAIYPDTSSQLDRMLNAAIAETDQLITQRFIEQEDRLVTARDARDIAELHGDGDSDITAYLARIMQLHNAELDEQLARPGRSQRVVLVGFRTKAMQVCLTDNFRLTHLASNFRAACSLLRLVDTGEAALRRFRVSPAYDLMARLPVAQSLLVAEGRTADYIREALASQDRSDAPDTNLLALSLRLKAATELIREIWPASELQADDDL